MKLYYFLDRYNNKSKKQKQKNKGKKAVFEIERKRPVGLAVSEKSGGEACIPSNYVVI